MRWRGSWRAADATRDSARDRSPTDFAFKSSGSITAGSRPGQSGRRKLQGLDAQSRARKDARHVRRGLRFESRTIETAMRGLAIKRESVTPQ
jgi:hypothetical protein